MQTGYFKVLANANSRTNKLLENGFEVYKYESGNRYYVFVGEFDNLNAAKSTLSDVKEVVASAYIKKIDFKLNKTERNTDENISEKKPEEKSNALSQETEEKEVEKKNEQISKIKDFDFYKNQSGFVFKNGYLSEINGNNFIFSFPNGETKSYRFLNENGRDVKINTGYLLVFKKDNLIDLLPQKTKNNFSKSLQELGYNKDIILNPSRSEFQFALPISKNIIKKETSLKLYLEKAEFLNETIYVDIFINDNHLKTLKLNEPQRVHEYMIDLNNNIDLSEVLNIKVKTSFSTDGLPNSLEEHYEKPWITVHNNSEVHFTIKEEPRYNINNFLNLEVDEIRLLHGPNLSRNLMEKYIKTATRLNRKYKNKVSNIYVSDDKKAANLNNIYNRKRKIVISEEFKTTELLDNLTLKLAPKDAEFFFSKYNELINSNKLHLNSFNLMESKNSNLNFYGKNPNNNLKSGWGNIEYEYFIPGNIFDTNPREIKLHLTGSYFIPFNNQAHLKVYLNGKLIQVEELKKSKYFEDKIINIPGQEIESYNNLKIVFSQFPGENINKFSNVMEIYINPESYITYSGNLGRKSNFQNVLSNLSGKGKILLVEKYKEELLKTAVLFNKYIHQNDYSNLDFTVDYLNNYNIDNQDEDLKWYLVIGSEKINDKFKSKVKFTGENIQINSRKNEENISINFDKPISYIDINTIGNKSVVFLNTNGSYNNLEKMLLKINKKESIHELTGNLLIFNGENYKTFNIENQIANNQYNIYLSQFKNLIYEYKIHAYIISVILIILILIWIYYKTSRNSNRKDQE